MLKSNLNLCGLLTLAVAFGLGCDDPKKTPLTQGGMMGGMTGGTSGGMTGGTPGGMTGGTPGGMTGGTPGGMTVAPDPSCESYCATVMDSCTGENQQYDNVESCVDYCSNVTQWDLGVAGAADGNSVACRTYHADVAGMTDPEIHCAHAGPSGGSVCGSYCESYCQLANNNCQDDNALYEDTESCLSTCETFNQEGLPGDTQYDSVQCRIYHLGTPAKVAPETHCSHGAEVASDFCVGSPNDYAFRTEIPSEYTSVDRMGMPAVSTALITDKNAYNDGTPTDDAALTFAGELLVNIAGLHGALDDDLTGLGLTPCVATAEGDDLPACVTQRVVQGGPTVVSLVIPDTLKIDPSAAAGFPNGRRLADPVMDVTIAVILLDLVVHTPTALVGALSPTVNDLGVEGSFLSNFPYLHPPHE
jgi:hypothetical protein